jgi:hypothetical protein
MEGISMVNSSRGIHNVSNNTRRRREHSDTRKKYGKEKHVSTTWEIGSSIINEYFEYETSNIGGSLLQAFISEKPIKNLLFLELKTLQDLKEMPGLRKLDLFMLSIADSTQRSYKGGWSHFVSFFIEENDPFPNWKDENECIIIFGDFITWATDNIKLSEVNIACSVISKMFQCLQPTLGITKIQQIISLKRGALMSNPKQIKYLKLWNPDLVISYYTSTYTLTTDTIARYNFLQKKIAIFLGFLFMLRTFEAYQATINRNEKNIENSQLGYWLVTNLKNKKLLLSNIWIPNLLFTDNKNNLLVPTMEHQGNNLTMLNLAESIMNPQKSYLLSTFHVIQEFLTLILKDLNSLFVIQNSKDKMSLSAYRKLIKQAMFRYGN